MTLFARIWSPNLRRLTFRRRLGMFERSKDCDSRAAPEETCSSSADDDPCCEPCPSYPSPTGEPPCPPDPSTYFSRGDPRKLVFWRMMSLCAFPVLLVMSIITYARQKEKAKEPREPFLNLPYMCIRTKPFPWGDGNHTLFHNPVKNPVPPHGYEVEDPNAPKKAGN
ncbi:hypothetical protein P5V15_005018 [Pogonomyrmex californicus]